MEIRYRTETGDFVVDVLKFFFFWFLFDFSLFLSLSLCTEHPEIPQRTGKLNEVNKFDAAFFGVHFKQAQTMDPMSRILLEKAYEAVVDSGKLDEFGALPE